MQFSCKPNKSITIEIGFVIGLRSFYLKVAINTQFTDAVYGCYYYI